MFILLPPSEGKSPDPGPATFRTACPAWAGDTAAVLDHLKSLSPAARMKFYGARTAEKADAAHALNRQALDAPALPAVERYTGVVYTHLDYAGLRRKAAARKRLLIVSALFGVVQGGTPVPEYKLAVNPWLARYWKPINTARIEALAGGKPVLDLLSQSYRRALDYPNLVTIDFRVQGGKKAAGHFGKVIKGRFARWLLENNVQKVSDFGGFTEDGYRFDGVNFIQGGAGTGPR